jgi:hypothetical protein
MDRPTARPTPSWFFWAPLRSGWRRPAAAALALAAGAHVPVIAPHLDEAPYLGEEFIVLTAACALLAVALLVCDSAAAYLLTAVTGGLAIAGYAITRLVELPLLADDVGNWFEPLGVASVAAEAVAVVSAVLAWLPRRRPGRAACAVRQDAPWAPHDRC